jgi:hypothetical protein
MLLSASVGEQVRTLKNRKRLASEFHFVHSLSGVPMKEGLSLEHSSELLVDSLEQFLDGSAVSDKGH